MLFPPSLSPEIRLRAFRAMNGELGIRAEDVGAFLDACDADGVEVLGWELWLADHAWVAPTRVASAPGSWSGGIPRLGGHPPSVRAGDGNSRAARAAIAALSFDWVDPASRPYLRFNFVLDTLYKPRCRNWLNSLGL